jgi:hypothetical protein
VKNSNRFKAAMSALMADLGNGLISESRANAICNAGGKLLKAVELEQRFGIRAPAGDGSKTLSLVADSNQ